ncbi:MAG: fasciclin domain-containing protein [Phycisphaerales bacterium]
MLQRTFAVAARSLTIGCAVALAPTAIADHDDAGASNATIAEIATNAGNFTTLIAAVEAAGLTDAFTGDGPLTVFAPTDAAFAKLPKNTVQSLLRPENREALRRVLLYHAIDGRILGADALGAGEASTLAGETVVITLRDGRLTINDSGVIANDIIGSNGVIHVIDTVLLPPAAQPQGRLVIGVFTDNAGRTLRSQLGIERGLVVTGLTRGGNALEAGLERDDVIAMINGRPATSDVLAEEKAEVGFGGVVTLSVFRAGEHIEIEVPVGAERH